MGAATRHALDPFLLAAVAVRESGLNPTAVGSVGEAGIVQLHPRGAGRRVRYVQDERYRTRCARQPGACQAEVLEVGAKLLSDAIKRCGSEEDGLGAYQSGRCGASAYSRRVLRERDRIKGYLQ